MKIEYRENYNSRESKYISCTYIRFGSEQGIGPEIIAYNICNQLIKIIPVSLVIEITNEID